jgi:hypothetical protein
MNWLRFVSSMALAGQLAIGAAPADRDKTKTGEPADSMVLTLPGLATPAALPVIAPLPAVPAPAPASVKAPIRVPIVAIRREPSKSPVEAEPRPSPKGIKPALSADFVKESSVFCQKQVGQWKQADARELFGAPLRQRPSYGEDKKTANGRIYAFADPTGRYKELELDFDRSSGTLRTVFVYPPRLTWEECRRLWGSNVTSTDARQGRTFYSYLNRRLDVLVDPKGKVISLGLY